MNMREKIARAIYAKIPNRYETRELSTAVGQDGRAMPGRIMLVDETWDEAPDRHAQCLELADAVLDALREPTPNMLRAATMQVPTWDDEASKRKWIAMIDAAKEE